MSGIVLLIIFTKCYLFFFFFFCIYIKLKLYLKMLITFRPSNIIFPLAFFMGSILVH